MNAAQARTVVSQRVAALLITLSVLSHGCGQSATGPSSSAQPPEPMQPPPPIAPPTAAVETFEVAGTVTDHRGVPLPGAMVMMGLWSAGFPNWPSVLTDASGNYRMTFAASARGDGFVARAQLTADGYEEYWRNLVRTGGRTTFIENFSINRVIRVAAGDSVVVSVPPDLGECRGWVAVVCAVVRITIPTAGRLSIDVVPIDAPMERPPLEVCCESGTEVGGNPVAMNVTPGPELQMNIGLGRGISTSRSFRVTTSLLPF